MYLKNLRIGVGITVLYQLYEDKLLVHRPEFKMLSKDPKELHTMQVCQNAVTKSRLQDWRVLHHSG
jgi:hypothetical protein